MLTFGLTRQLAKTPFWSTLWASYRSHQVAERTLLYIGFEDTASIALAANHLNTGDGSIVPQVARLNERCKIRFTMEMVDSAFDGGASLRLINELTGRDIHEPHPRPTAFIGPYRSAVSMSTSIINGALGYPQVSPGSAAPELDDKTQYPLFGRTVPSDEGRNLSLVLYLKNVLQLKHLAVIYVNDAYGNGFVEYLRRIAEVHAPDMENKTFSISFKDRSVEEAIESVKVKDSASSSGRFFNQTPLTKCCQKHTSKVSLVLEYTTGFWCPVFGGSPCEKV